MFICWNMFPCFHEEGFPLYRALPPSPVQSPRSVVSPGMESNRKRRGFLKGKVMALYRPNPNAAARSFPPVQHPGGKGKLPNQTSPSNSPALLIQQDCVLAPPNPNVTFLLPGGGRGSVSRYEEMHGAEGDEETVDARAASYISYVQQRFHLDRVNSERMKHPDLM